MEERIPAVAMRNITKRFGSVVASDKCWLNIYRGEILAMLGDCDRRSLFIALARRG